MVELALAPSCFSSSPFKVAFLLIRRQQGVGVCMTQPYYTLSAYIFA